MKQLENNEKFCEGLDILFRLKPRHLSLLKFLEELSELQCSLLKEFNKGESQENVLEELVDASMHIQLRLKDFSKEDIENCVERKVLKMYSSKDFKHYLNIEQSCNNT